MNRLVLRAKLVERAALRYTPAGLPALDVSVEHESEVTQEGRARKVKFEIRARGIGRITERLAAVELGSERGFSGFLSAQRNGRGIVFHVTELD